MPQTLTLKELNRATLARQLLLNRHDMPITDAIETLVGMQSQIPNPPYIGLWTRLQQFERDDLTQLMEQKQVVRAAMMRSTLHLVTADDHQKLRPILQPALERALRAFFGKKAKALDVKRLVKVAKPFLEDEPRSTGELKDFLLTIAPDEDADAMAYAIRTYLPLVQVPPGGTWGSGTRAGYSTATQYLGEADGETLKYMLKRYLAAFGPASIMDFQAWSGLVSLKKTIEAFKDDFVIYEDESGTELLDLPDMRLPDASTPAPVRFIPEYDNLLVSHKDRNRIIADDDRQYVFLSAARVLATVLVDGFVQATWKAERNKETATLNISLFNAISSDLQDELVAEGERLLRWLEDDAGEFVVAFVD